jgi:uncharacterized protein with PIN domain
MQNDAMLRSVPTLSTFLPATSSEQVYNISMAEQRWDIPCAWCGFAGGLVTVGEHVHIPNAQVTMQHVVGRCPECEHTTAFASWGQNTQFRYKVLEYKRRFRRSTWIAQYDVQCMWCNGRTTEPAEINITAANPVSQRFKYDLYRCSLCGHMTAISYLGEVRRHRAVRDEVYRELWYLDPE